MSSGETGMPGYWGVSLDSIDGADLTINVKI